MKIIHFLFFAFFTNVLLAADKKYPISEIPDSLLKNANSVMRMDRSSIIVNSLSSVTNKIHFAITILNENGDKYGALVAHYDKLRKVSNFDGALYDASGTLIRKLKTKDILDLSATDEANFDDASRIKTYQFYYNKYPYTVEYSYATTTSHTFYLEEWIPQARERFSVQQSSYELNIPRDFGIRYKIYNAEEPVQKEENGRLIYRWELSNRPPIKIQPPFSSWQDYLIAVFAAPNDFQLENLKGNMESWKNYGLFQYQLLKGRDQLPGQIKARVRELTESSKDKIETIKILYRYLQQNTRYISIQLGIGGWQPFDAEYVARRGYGDCKALTNYMHSLLKEAGIPSYYALVNGGKDNYDRNRVKEDFPSVQFNHVILCVPSDADTTWLECTSQTLPAGYVSGFTSNRKALLIKEDGGYLVSTPRYGITDNLQLRKSKINIGENGDAKVYVETKYKGMEQDELLGLLNNISQDRVKRFLSSAISIPSYELNDYQYRPSASRIPELTETLSITARSLAAISGKRLFLTPNVFSKSSHLPDFDATRKIDFIFENSYYDSAEIEFIIPPGYSIESFIKPVSITTDFGRYTMSCTLLDNKIIYHRSLSQSESRIPLSRQEEITNFIREVYKADRAKLVLIKKD